VHGVRLRSIVLPGFLPGVRSSDHWAFYRRGYPAFMMTDTGPLRSRRDHTAGDTPSPVDFERLARIVPGIAAIVANIAGSGNEDAPRA
jgi:hypothetical protein